MPAHIVIAHAAALLAPAVGLAALAYGMFPASRRGIRWPLIVLSLIAAALVIWAGVAGHDLLKQLQPSASPAEYQVAFAHAKNSDGLMVAVCLVPIVGAFGDWRYWRGPQASSTAGRVTGWLLAICGIAVIVTTWITVSDAVAAVWMK